MIGGDSEMRNICSAMCFLFVVSTKKFQSGL